MMTDNEIINALKTCRISNCGNCSYIRMFPCKEYLANDVLALINRQKAEIENYSQNNRNMTDSIYKMQKLIERQNTEIERYKTALRNSEQSYRNLMNVLVQPRKRNGG